MSGLVPVDVAALGVGAFFGALSRYQAGKIAADFIATDPKRFGKLAGWHTAGLNVSGSFLLGVIYAMPAVDTNKINQLQSGVAGKPLDRFQGLTPRAKLMLGVGFCGSFTTFSTFSVDVVTWLSEGRTTRALSYIATNNVCSIAAAGFGMMVMKKLLAKA
mmetsp:Transcript_25564/g.54572  ORF Transcript_25564/g.54572 Transcript_25564/m.54572 type:complete len:160 (-) Transcript_25564:717-1196(-)|eukprot:CAMPEP_0201118366 /NCGR_PEP_ID=MMETSP0850-20130426/2536_1 /ASSEMBLY_ACC=CAM_ASM_000622 /TAXON_ID=183588 /ORGANISM="Pseudo-nitzschia fraudulenta, Strain WWA7" /LENGTH=159 /DNA_ID=CAMNT_0047383519 /DNA_START=85 /DNA_END=564 /DNA_ORIENTATION=-